MKRPLISLTFGLALVLLMYGMAQAATMSLLDVIISVNFYSQSWASVSSGVNTASDGPNINPGNYGAGSSAYANLYVPPSPPSPFVSVTSNPGSGSSAYFFQPINPYQIHPYIYGTIGGFSNDPGGNVQAFTSTVTGRPGYGDGIYWVINPEGAENPGDQVLLSWSWTAAAATFTNSYVTLSGGQGYADHLAITRTSGSNTQEMWSLASMTVSDGAGLNESTSGSFSAQIGDIIGIHLGMEASIDFTGSAGAIGRHFSTDMIMDISSAAPIPIPGAVWLLGSGLLGLGAWRRFKKS